MEDLVNTCKEDRCQLERRKFFVCILGYEKRILVDAAGDLYGGISPRSKEPPHLKLIDGNWYDLGPGYSGSRCSKYHMFGSSLCNEVQVKGTHFVGNEHLVYEGSIVHCF